MAEPDLYHLLIQDQLKEQVRVARCEDLKFEPGVEVSLPLVEAIIEGPRSTFWGALVERYAAERLRRSHAQGHDARLGKDLVNVKTITRRSAMRRFGGRLGEISECWW